MENIVFTLIVFFILLLAFVGILRILESSKSQSQEFLVKLRFTNYQAHMAITVYAVDKEMAQLLAKRLQKVMDADGCEVL